MFKTPPRLFMARMNSDNLQINIMDTEKVLFQKCVIKSSHYD